MLTGRRTKLAIAVAILIVGIGAAFLFRREDPSTTRTASKKNTTSAAAEQSARKPIAQPRAAEPSLAGHIEPYGWKDAPSGASHQTLTNQPATTFPEAHSKPSSTPPQNVGDSKRSTADQPASYATPPSQRLSADASSKRKPFDITAESNPAVLKEQDATVFDRFATLPRSAGAMADGKRHKIIDGDTLVSIAKRYLGTESRYLDLFEHNRDVLADPELLPIGKELRIPSPNFVRAAAPPKELLSTDLIAVAPPVAPLSDLQHIPEQLQARSAPLPTNHPTQQTYIVQAHDTLGLIARKVYGDIGRQSELLAANRRQLRTPQDLRPGMTLIVPGVKHPE